MNAKYTEHESDIAAAVAKLAAENARLLELLDEERRKLADLEGENMRLRAMLAGLEGEL